MSDTSDPSSYGTDDILGAGLHGRFIILGLRDGGSSQRTYPSPEDARRAYVELFVHRNYLIVGCMALHPSVMHIKKVIITENPTREVIGVLFQGADTRYIMRSDWPFSEVEQTVETLRPDVTTDDSPILHSAGVGDRDNPE